MPRLLPTFADLPAYSYAVDLDGVRHRLRFRWFDRLGAWYLDLYTADGEPLLEGARLSPGWGPWAGLARADLPAGQLYVRGVDPYTRDALGDAVELVYLTADDVDRLVAAAAPSADVLPVVSLGV